MNQLTISQIQEIQNSQQAGETAIVNVNQGANSNAAIALNKETGSLRTQLIIINTSASTTITLFKGDQAATQNMGIILKPAQALIESNDSGFLCWQGAMQAIGSDGNGTLSTSVMRQTAK
jgi:hypothetical protein